MITDYKIDADSLAAALPAVMRERDLTVANPKGALQALLGALARELDVVRTDIDALYDGAFIETCAPWLVPYIGELLGVKGLHAVSAATLSPRAVVANTLAYRRRKGTATVIEQLARDLTGWDTRVVEFFQLLGTTQHLNHIRPGKGGTVNLRDTAALENIQGAFDTAAHTLEVRSSAAGGRYHPQTLGIFLHRLQAYTVNGGDATAITAAGPGRYTFSPLGCDLPLFFESLPETSIEHLAEPVNVSAPLSRRPLWDELEDLRAALALGQNPKDLVWFDVAHPAFQVIADDAVISPVATLICDLTDWHLPADTKVYPGFSGPVNMPIRCAVDPVLGRIAFPAGVFPSSVQVTYAYGFPGDIGGGPYLRRRRSGELGAAARLIANALPSSAATAACAGESGLTGCEEAGACAGDPFLAWPDTLAFPRSEGELYRVFADQAGGPHPDAETLSDAVALWIVDGRPRAVIQIEDSRSYVEDVVLDLGDAELIVQAQEGDKPALLGSLEVTGGSGAGKLLLDGLLFAGAITATGDTDTLALRHCTLVPGLSLDADGQSLQPGQPSLEVLHDTVRHNNEHLSLHMHACIAGPLRLPPAMVAARISDSVIQAPDNVLPAYAADAAGEPGARACLVRCTVLGDFHAVAVDLVSDTLFTEAAVADRLQEGCTRFSYLPEDSQLPRRHRCQPDTAIAKAWEELGESASPAAKDAAADMARSRMHPQFTALRLNAPAFAQLAEGAATELKTQASNESEIGAWNALMQPQREANLRSALDEYLRLGLTATVIHAT